MASSDKDTSKMVVLFKIMYDRLDFHQVPMSTKSARGTYLATPFVLVEMRDDIGIIRYRKQWTDSIYAATYLQSNSRTDFVYGSLVASLPAGNYSANLTLGDQENQIIKRIDLPVTHSIKFDTSKIYKPLFVEFSQTPSSKVVPIVSAGNARFSQLTIRALVPVSGVKAGDTYSYSCSAVQLPDGNMSNGEWGAIPTIGGIVKPELRQYLTTDFPINSPTQKPNFTIEKAEIKTAFSSLGLLDITLPANAISPGKYKLRIVKVGTRDTATHQFDVVWEDMPISFRNTRAVVENMYSILTDDEFDAVNSGSESEKRKNVIDYWQKKYPSAESVYNTTMAEYYRRVDYSLFNFQGIAEPDGAKSERGKIYILHGAPTAVEKNIPASSGQAQEIWTYSNKVKKQFTFELNTSGVYKLKNIKDLAAK
ncbi:MAG: GWxTD domain-containing protein [Ignavibacteria bacterium]|nr:GWxTD domain-containing protein [Ignavibacteria bacterium]